MWSPPPPPLGYANRTRTSEIAGARGEFNAFAVFLTLFLRPFCYTRGRRDRVNRPPSIPPPSEVVRPTPAPGNVVRLWLIAFVARRRTKRMSNSTRIYVSVARRVFVSDRQIFEIDQNRCNFFYSKSPTFSGTRPRSRLSTSAFHRIII